MCEAAGFDILLVETVGVGQSETAVAAMVDFFLVLMIAGAGDELQGIKKGVLELADGIAINKADGDNQDRVARAKKDLENAMHLILPASAAWQTPVMTCSSVIETGRYRCGNRSLRTRKLSSDPGSLSSAEKARPWNGCGPWWRTD